MNLPKSAEITFGELQQNARAQCIEILRKALNVLEKHDIPGLEQMARERHEEHMNRLMAAED